MSNIWMYWEGPLPEHLRLCMRSVEYRKGHLDFALVTPQTLNRYLPDLGQNFRLIERPAHRADYIRTRLVHTYGGLWLDSDLIALERLESLVAFPPGIDFACQTPGSAIGCFAAAKGSDLLAQIIDAQDEVIGQNEGRFGWNDIGNKLFSRLAATYPIHQWPKWALDEIAGGKVRTLLSRTAQPSEHVSPNAVVFHLCNEVSRPFFQRYLRPGRVLASQMLISKLLRRGLDIPEPTSRALWLEAALDYHVQDLSRAIVRKITRRSPGPRPATGA